jgi:hypothetical protein
VFCHGCDHGDNCETKFIDALGFFGQQLDNKGLAKGTDSRSLLGGLKQSAQKEIAFYDMRKKQSRPISKENVFKLNLTCIIYLLGRPCFAPKLMFKNYVLYSDRCEFNYFLHIIQQSNLLACQEDMCVRHYSRLYTKMQCLIIISFVLLFSCHQGFSCLLYSVALTILQLTQFSLPLVSGLLCKARSAKSDGKLVSGSFFELALCYCCGRRLSAR